MADRQSNATNPRNNTSLVSQVTYFDMNQLDQDDDGFGRERQSNRWAMSQHGNDSYDDEDVSDSDLTDSDSNREANEFDAVEDQFDSTFLVPPNAQNAQGDDNIDNSMRGDSNFFTGRINSIVPSDACPP